MKKLISIGFCIISLIACQDVITIDPPTEAPRLSIDALIRIDDSAPITTAVVYVALTNSFFAQTTPTDVNLITIRNLDHPKNEANENTLVLSKSGEGRYIGSKETDFFTSGKLELIVEHNKQKYSAQTKYVPTVPITSLKEGTQTLFTGNETEIIISLIDAPNRTDFYLFDFSFNEYLASEDTFYQGQKFEFSYFYEKGLKSGSNLEISVIGIDEQFYHYMNQLIAQTNANQGSFQTPAATIRGNFTNITNGLTADNSNQSTNFALGYFSVSQAYKKTITLK